MVLSNCYNLINQASIQPHHLYACKPMVIKTWLNMNAPLPQGSDRTAMERDC
ncbi:hypothetical protein [Nostoc sp. DedQUE09]|uniref:hypothetical protein n=1 Tax=Nostoc sp. DedQUE09 TaxID=3075394 RepID=UPI002AD31804|nr:hypothetical protein [Nostoc sp. DedQUE09]MDZ7950728.1 hypothetical protein [Nostoc sp. DedQUE09]